MWYLSNVNYHPPMLFISLSCFNLLLFIVVLGFLSYVGGKGSVYISELVKEFSDHSHEKDVNSMLESVSINLMILRIHLIITMIVLIQYSSFNEITIECSCKHKYIDICLSLILIFQDKQACV